MKTILKISFILLNTLFIIYYANCQVRMIQSIVSKESNQKLEYHLIQSLIYFNDYNKSNKNNQNRMIFNQKLNSLSHDIVIDVSQEEPLLDVLIKIENSIPVDLGVLTSKSTYHNARYDFITAKIRLKDLEKFNQVFKEGYDKMLLSHFDQKNKLIIDVDPITML